MSEQYTYPEEKPQMGSEPTNSVQYSSDAQYRNVPYHIEADFDTDTAPCQYSLEEVKTILKKNRDEYKNGRYHTMETINRIMDGWC